MVKRILILDWDVHHGNATQHQFENNPNVLYISLHNACIFPGGLEKWADRVGIGHGVGFNINIAWDDCGARDLEYLSAFTNVVLPVLYEYCPDLVLGELSLFLLLLDYYFCTAFMSGRKLFIQHSGFFL